MHRVYANGLHTSKFITPQGKCGHNNAGGELFKVEQRGAGNKTRQAIKKGRTMFRDRSAVSIRHTGSCCNAVRAVETQRFLSAEAPGLPLADCSTPNRCQCKYRHHTDRREDPRRDTEVGLPDRGFAGLNRRFLSGRRTSDAA